MSRYYKTEEGSYVDLLEYAKNDFLKDEKIYSEALSYKIKNDRMVALEYHMIEWITGHGYTSMDEVRNLVLDSNPCPKCQAIIDHCNVLRDEIINQDLDEADTYQYLSRDVKPDLSVF